MKWRDALFYGPRFKLIVARAGAHRLAKLCAHLKQFIDRDSSVKAGSGAFATHEITSILAHVGPLLKCRTLVN